MCCHEHPDNGAGLAVAPVGDTDLRDQLRQAWAVRDEAEAQVAELVSREVGLLARLRELGKRLRWLSTYEKNPPEVVKDDFAYERLLAWVRAQATDWVREFLD